MIVIGIDPGTDGFHAVALLLRDDDSRYIETYRERSVPDKVQLIIRSAVLHRVFTQARAMIHDIECRWNDPDEDNRVYVFVEEPPLAGARNVRTFAALNQTVGAVVAALTTHTPKVYLVPVDTWKKAVCGAGGLSKTQVTAWLNRHHPDYAALCDGSQDLIDACCIALHGVGVIADAELVRTIGSAGDL